MTAKLTTATVEGEPIELPMRALSGFQLSDQRDGMVRFSAELPPELGEPLMRALMRVEAECLLADADGLGRGCEERTYEQRSCDALVELTRRVSCRGEAARVG
jgi:hypothetical protein